MKDKRALLIFLTVFIDLVGFGIIIPLTPYLGKQFGADAVQVGWLMSIYSLMQFIFAPIWGKLSDRFGRRPIIMISLLSSSLSHLGFAFAQNYLGLFIFRLLAGIGGGNLAAAMAYMADVTDEKDRSKGMGLIGAAFGLGFILGPALGGVFGDLGHHLGSAPPLGGSFPAVVAGLICFLNLVGAYFYLPETRSRSERSQALDIRGPVARLLKIFRVSAHSGLGTVYLIYFCNSLALALVEVPLFLYVAAKFHWSMSQASFGFAYIGIIMVFTQGFLIRKLLPRLGERRMLPLGLGFLTLGLVGSAFTATPWSMAPFITALALGYGLSNPSLTGSISLLSSKEAQGENLGVAQSLAALSRILGPVLGGLAFQRITMNAPFFFAGVVAALGLLLCVMIFSRLRAGEGQVA